MKRIPSLACVVAGLACLVAGPVAAHDLTVQECHEGGDFIRNAALSRDGGITREQFIDRIRSDIDLIQAFPPDLRWFVQDAEDEQLLVGAAQKVFDAPTEPEQHRDEFLTHCFAAIERWARR